MNPAQRMAERLLTVERQLERITERQQRDAARKQRLERERLERRCGLTHEAERAYRALRHMDRAAGLRRG